METDGLEEMLRRVMYRALLSASRDDGQCSSG